MNKKFTDMAREAFAYLEDAGFYLVSSSASELRYETPQVFITVEWDNRSGELEVFIGLQSEKNGQRGAFSLTDLLRMEGVKTPERSMPFQVADEDRLEPFLQKLSEDVRVHAQPALVGDRMFFSRLDAFRSAQAETYMQNMRLQQVRSEVAEAWRNRRLDKVIDLYASIESHLTNSEKEKLNYAKKHLGH